MDLHQEDVEEEADSGGPASGQEPIPAYLDPCFISQLRELKEEGGPGFVVDMIDAFLRDYPGRVAQLRLAVSQSDWQTATYLAHTMKGGCGMFGARQIVAVCGQLELACRSQAADAAVCLLRQVDFEFGTLCRALRQIRSEEISA